MKTRDSTVSERREAFLKEYSTERNIRRYVKKTAGHGISYLLEHDYGDIYFEVINKYLAKTQVGKGLRLLEFGCGAGMNLLHLVSVLERRGTIVDFACGTDFSAALIESAKLEAKDALTPPIADKVKFCVAKNDSLLPDMARELNANAAQYETALSKIGPYEDTKGFRRGALTAAAQENRYEAKQMQEQYATHLVEARALYGKVQPH